MQQRLELNPGEAPQLAGVGAFAFADVVDVVVHWVNNGTGVLKRLAGWKVILMKQLAVRTTGRREGEFLIAKISKCG